MKKTLILKPKEYNIAKKISKLHKNSYRCIACGTTDKLTNHHLIPRKKGGKGKLNNTVKICRECHDAIHGFRTKKIKLRRLINKYKKTHKSENIYHISRTLGIPVQDVVMILYPRYWEKCVEKHQLRILKEISNFFKSNENFVI
jgi:hypothetical protein